MDNFRRLLLPIVLILSSGIVNAQKPPAPIFSPASGTVTCPLTVNVSDAEASTVMLLTNDGSSPSTSALQMANPGQYYGPLGPFPVTKTTTLKAVALTPTGASPPTTDLVSGETDATYTCNASVWGFADLHAHPASFLAFGSDTDGENGLMWGKPAHDGAMDRATSVLESNLAADLPACPSATIPILLSGFTHNNRASSDPIEIITDNQIITELEQTSPGWVHHPLGFSGPTSQQNFQDWPAALTVDHQVMHIDNIYRAYQGGLRLMFASVTNDEIISKLWTQRFNLGGSPMPTHDPNFDFNSAVQQLTYITNLVNANGSWMEIVTSPSQARAAINSNPPKLAVVLSLEMDSLSLKQIQSLVQQFGVAHVIPVHVVNNSFGGTALYSDQFNGLNNFINGSYYSPTTDPNVNFALSYAPHLEAINPSTLLTLTGINGVPSAGITMYSLLTALAASASPPTWITVAVGWGASAVLGVNLMPAGALGYMPSANPSPLPPGTCAQPPPQGGQVNSADLNQSEFFALMQMGLLLDIVHMGEKTAGTALTMAQQYRYPLMDSHTGIRCDSDDCPVYKSGAPLNAQTAGILGVNERSLPISQLKIISQLGGVIGIGEVPGTTPPCGPNSTPDPDPVTTWINGYSIAVGLMNNKGVAIGTDADGLSPLLQQDTQSTNYPINVAMNFNCPAGCATLPQYNFGGRTYDFQKDGIANYGLLPDFIQAASQSRPVSIPLVYDASCKNSCTATYSECVSTWNPGDYPVGTQSPCAQDENQCLAKCPSTGGGFKPGLPPTQAIATLFHSAEDTIEMWEKVEQALIITSADSLTGEVGMPFSQTLLARGGTPPYTWSVQNGSKLPPGLNLDQSGKISGSGTLAGTFVFTIAVQDSTTPAGPPSTLAFGMTMDSEPCDQAKNHVIIMCGDPSVKTCVIPPATCPTQGGNPK